VVSGRQGECLRRRAEDLGIKTLHMGVKEKLPVVEEVIREHGVTWAETAFFGDDIVDLLPLAYAGVSAAPADADCAVRRRVDLVTDRPGGGGAVRELVEKLLKASGRWKAVSSRYFVAQGVRS
jgi:3-deoxy-D-manno-octulosonate 8-phosphate phosphatase (KDO 8-P phosphatase)